MGKGGLINWHCYSTVVLTSLPSIRFTTNKMSKVAVLVVVGALLIVADCYPSGAGLEACSNLSLIPLHGGAPATGESPYAVSTSSLSYTPGESITVTIAGTEAFKGFLLVATIDEENPVGSFTSTNELTQSQCGSDSNLGLTHKTGFAPAETTNELIAEWTAPADLTAEVTIYATVVKETAIYYVKLGGLKLTKQEPAASSTIPGVTPGATIPDTSSDTSSSPSAAETSAPDEQTNGIMTPKSGSPTALCSGLLLTAVVFVTKYLV